MAGLRVAAAYALGVFSVGFVLGSIRFLAIVPRIGTRSAELLELPLMVGASLLGAGCVNRRLGLEAAVRTGLAVGVAALLLLLAAEAATGLALRGVSVRDALVNAEPMSGSLYYASLLAFAALPAIRGRGGPDRRWRRRTNGAAAPAHLHSGVSRITVTIWLQNEGPDPRPAHLVRSPTRRGARFSTCCVRASARREIWPRTSR